MNGKTSRWSECGQIYFLYGKAYGIRPPPEAMGVTANLDTICLGTEEDVLKFLETGELRNGLPDIPKQTLVKIKKYREEEGYGKNRAGAGDMERAVDNGSLRRKPKAIRRFKARKGLSMRTPRTADQSLSCK